MLFGPEHAWIRSRKISQSSRAAPGARTARLRRCKRPSPLTIEPRFSAKPHAGNTTVACSVAAFERMSITMKAGRFASFSGVTPNLIGFSPRATSAFAFPEFTAFAIVPSLAPGPEFKCKIKCAPLVFGLRSVLNRMSSPGPVRGTMSINSTPSILASWSVSHSSSLVIRPEATIAISWPENCFNWSAACAIAVAQSAVSSLPSERIRGSHRVAAAIDETEHVILRDFLAETDAARAQNAALIVERNTRPEYDVFWFLYLVLEKPRLARAVIDAEFL